MVALLGPSGSGKSTLLRHLSGLITCDKNAGKPRRAGQYRCGARGVRQRYPQEPRPDGLHLPAVQPAEPPDGAGERADWRAPAAPVLAHLSALVLPLQKQETLQALTRVGMACILPTSASPPCPVDNSSASPLPAP